MSVNKLPRTDVLKQALIEFDQNLVTDEQIITLLRVWPKESPVEDLEKEKLEPNEMWDKAEAYMIHLCDRESWQARLKMWRFKATW